MDLLQRGVSPPAAMWVNADDFLFLHCRNSLAGVTVQVAARLLEPDGRITTPAFTLAPTSDRTLNTASQQLYSGWLLSATATVSGTPLPTRGQTYCVLKLQRSPAISALNHYLLGGDYISGSYGLQWPSGRLSPSLDGQGIMRSVLGTAPAAGADWSQAAPTSGRWRIRFITVSLTTSATVANRNPLLQFTDGTNLLLETENTIAQLAGTTVRYSWYISGNLGVNQGLTNFALPLPEHYLFPAWVVRVVTGGLQAADQWTAPRFAVEEWLED